MEEGGRVLRRDHGLRLPSFRCCAAAKARITLRQRQYSIPDTRFARVSGNDDVSGARIARPHNLGPVRIRWSQRIKQARE
jgi:hypothetical protein